MDTIRFELMNDPKKRRLLVLIKEKKLKNTSRNLSGFVARTENKRKQTLVGNTRLTKSSLTSRNALHH